MTRRGRAKSVVCWCLIGLMGLSGTGCSINVNWSDAKRPAPPAPKPDVATLPDVNAFNAGPRHDSGVRQASLRPGDGALAPTPVPLGSDGKPGCTVCVDANVAVPPALHEAYREFPGGFPPGPYNPLPTELAKKTHPAYVIEPPDILLIDTGRLVPRPPYVIQALDVLIIQATETFPNQPINGTFVVGPDGTVALGFGYGVVRVGGLTLEKAQQAIRALLEKTLKNPQVSLGLGAFQSVQQIRGEHLVRAEGTVSLGVYGCVYIAGMSLCKAQTVIEQHLSQFFQDPEISLDVFAYNSKAYYVVVDGGGYGMQVVKFPITGNETVLDAINNIGGLPAVSSRRRIWVARPTPANHECVQILPVDWLAIVQAGSTRTNYQLFPGDRVYIKADPLIRLDNVLAKIISPIERLLGVTLLGVSTVNAFNNNGGNGNVGFVTGF